MEQKDGVAEQCWDCPKVVPIEDIHGQIAFGDELLDGVFCGDCWEAAGTKELMEKDTSMKILEATDLNDYIERTKNGSVFDGSDMNIWNAIVLASQLRLYASTGIKPNRFWTVRDALRTATHFTEIKYKRTELQKAAEDLTNYADLQKLLPKTDKQKGE